ncbi:UNVERIFIED_CONTAM: E3 ubiquitin-protein ligase RDUF2 [Sesamum calycinum]|uniref:RING-type E3 ubiquitin transferase n=1 Tax=Sesamum calycinum TaxID=2727403 RepID=A0AAW2SDI4_9LAMI
MSPCAATGGSLLLFCHMPGGFQSVRRLRRSLPEPPRRFVSPPSGFSRRRRNGSSFNPLIVLRSPPESEPPPAAGAVQRSYELYYDDGSGSVQPLGPAGKSAASNSRRLVTAGRNPASHVDSDAHCAVCTDAFTLGSEAREMPCKHIFTPIAFFPWLNLHNSCPSVGTSCRATNQMELRVGPRRRVRFGSSDGAPVRSRSLSGSGTGGSVFSRYVLRRNRGRDSVPMEQ